MMKRFLVLTPLIIVMDISQGSRVETRLIASVQESKVKGQETLVIYSPTPPLPSPKSLAFL